MAVMMQQEEFAYMRIKEKWPDEVCYYCGGRKRHQKEREREKTVVLYSLMHELLLKICTEL